MGLLQEYSKANGKTTISPASKTTVKSGGGMLQQMGQTSIKPITTQAPQITVQPQKQIFKTPKALLGKVFDKVNSIVDLKRTFEQAKISTKEIIPKVEQAGVIVSKQYREAQDKYSADLEKRIKKEKSPLTKKYLEKNLQGIQKISQGRDVVLNKVEKNLQAKADQALTKTEAERQKLGKAKTKTQNIADMVAGSVPSLATNIGLGVAATLVTKNPSLGLMLGFSNTYSQSASDIYREAKQSGVSDKKSQEVAASFAPYIAAIDIIPIGKLLNRSGGGEVIKKSLIRNVTQQASRLGTQALLEGGTEAWQQVAQNAAAKTYNEHKNLLEGVKESFFVGSLLGAVSEASIGKVLSGNEAFTTKEVNQNVETKLVEAFNTPTEQRTAEQQMIVEAILKKELKPQEAIDLVMASELQNTQVGRELIKAAAKAIGTDKSIVLNGSEDLQSIDFEVVDNAQVREQVTEIRNKAIAGNLDFQTKVDGVAKELGFETAAGPVKGVARMTEKAITDYQGDVTRIKDVNRSTILIDDPAKLDTLVEKLEKEFGGIDRVKNDFNRQGYQGAIINVPLGDGRVAEVQVTTPEMHEARRKYGGYDFYKQVRTKKGNWQQVETDMKKLYADAAASVEARLKSSSDISDPSTNALTGGNGAPDAVTPKTSSVVESSSTLTSTSSTSKNLGKDGSSDGSIPATIAENKASVNVPRSQLPQGAGKEKASRLEARITKQLRALSEDDIDSIGVATYQEINKKENIAAAAEYVTENPDKALQVLQGEIEAPKGILRNSIFVAMQNYAEGNVELARRLASLQATRFGQELSVLTEIDPNSPVKILEDIVKIREEAVKKRTGKKSVTEATKDTVKKAKSYVKKPDKHDWSNFIESIRC